MLKYSLGYLKSEQTLSVVIPAKAGNYKGTGFLFSQETLDSASSAE